MAQLSGNLVVDPFGEVNTFHDGGRVRVKATILMKPSVEGAQTALAIDGSNSMTSLFGISGSVSPLFCASPNVVEAVAKTLGTYLANFDSDGETSIIYWACGVGGGDIEDLGDMNAQQIAATRFHAPKKFGTGTRLLPAIKHFIETRFTNSPWTILVFITDGAIEDLDAVKAYSLDLGKQIADGKRKFIKLVLIGVGPHAVKRQMEELDDLDYGGLKTTQGDEIDLWDHKMASTMKKIEEIFAEVVTSETILAPSATITDSNGDPVKPIGRSSYADGLPALLEFDMPSASKSFTLTVAGGPSVIQRLA